MKINMHEAISQLSRLGEMAWQGESIVIAKAGKPYLDLLPHKETRVERKPGLLKGQIKIADDFDETPLEIINESEAYQCKDSCLIPTPSCGESAMTPAWRKGQKYHCRCAK